MELIGASGSCLGAFLLCLAASRVPLRASRGRLGRPLGRVLRSLGDVLGKFQAPPRGILGRLGVSWGVLEASWACFFVAEGEYPQSNSSCGKLLAK